MHIFVHSRPPLLAVTGIQDCLLTGVLRTEVLLKTGHLRYRKIFHPNMFGD